MPLSGIGSGPEPQGFLNKVINTLKKAGNWLGRRKVQALDLPRQRGLEHSEGLELRTLTSLSSRKAATVSSPAGALSSAGIQQKTGLQNCLGKIEKMDDMSDRLLAHSPYGANHIRAAINALGHQAQQLDALQKELKSEISKDGENIPASDLDAALARNDQLTGTLAALKDRITILEKRFENNPSSPYHLLKAQLDHYQGATSAVVKELEKGSGPKRAGQEKLLNQLLEKQDELQQRLKNASRSESASQGSIENLKHLPEQLVKTLKKQGVEVSLHSHKHTLAHTANIDKWDISSNPIHFQYQGGYHRFSEVMTPASQMRLTPDHLPDDLAQSDLSQGFFLEPYSESGVSSHSTEEVKHAVNLNTSQLLNDNGDVVFQCVRHAVHSPYGLESGSTDRAEGAFRRAEESAVAALHLHPEKMKAALEGNPVDLVLTSSSLLTPDVFRHAVGKSEKDEQAMLADQVAAWEKLNQQKTLPIRLPSGEIRNVPVNVKVVPFNFGLNKFSLGKTASLTGGWGPSDRLNKAGLETLVGPLTGGSSVHGGLTGEYLAKLQKEQPDHPDIQLIGQLVEQIRHLYKQNEHHNTKGGAAKLASRVMALTHMIGGTPMVNCKSAKDRTALAVADAEWLVTRMRLTGTVPEPDDITPADQELFLELALQGNHLKLQELNSGSPGFKVDSAVLKAYLESPEGRSYLKGLSEAVLA